MSKNLIRKAVRVIGTMAFMAYLLVLSIVLKFCGYGRSIGFERCIGEDADGYLIFIWLPLLFFIIVTALFFHFKFRRQKN